MPEPAPPATVAYFSMEIGLEPDLPTYSGGLGVLAGDTLRAAADLGVAMVGVSLVHRKGYFRQHVDEHDADHAHFEEVNLRPDELPRAADVERGHDDPGTAEGDVLRRRVSQPQLQRSRALA